MALVPDRGVVVLRKLRQAEVWLRNRVRAQASSEQAESFANGKLFKNMGFKRCRRVKQSGAAFES